MNRFLCAMTAFGLLAGCGDDPPPPAPAAPAAAAKPKPAAVEAAPKPAEPTLVYNYSGVGKRDPFRSPQGPIGGEVPREDTTVTNACKDPVCQVDIDELSVVAIVSGDANPMAMLEDRGGVGHIVHRNGYIGKGGAKVTGIRQDCIQVTTFPKGADGVVHPEKQDMCVKKDFTEAQTLDLLQGK